MASECTQETVLRFLSERGGRVKNADLIEHFRSAIPTEPGKKAAAREAFKGYVDSVAVVKVDNGEKYVCLKKKFRGWRGEGTRDGREQDGGAVKRATGTVPSERSEDEDAKQKIAPGSGCGTAAAPGVSGSASTSPATGAEPHGAEMGNWLTKKQSDQDGGARKLEDIPEVTVAEVSPEHVTGRTGGVSKSRSDQTVPDGLEGGSDLVELDSRSDQIVPLVGTSDHSIQKGLENPSDQTAQLGLEGQATPLELGSESDQKECQWLKRKPSGGSRRCHQSADETHADLVPGSDINTPKGSRKSFLKHMMHSSPQVRRSMALRSSVHLSTRCKDSSARSDGDAASLHSSGMADYENATVALEPLEHEWMMCASDGEWESLRRLLAAEPGLVCKKDFVTGFTCLHWAAKLGKAELLVLLVSFATQHDVLVDVNVRSGAGYTPLHLAAMHNHMEVVKLLIGAYDADVEVRDYSGKKASQYLRGEVARDVLDIVGAGTEVDGQSTDGGEGSGWRLSKVFQANLRPLKLLHHSTSEDDVSTAGENAGLTREKVLRRKTSLRGLRPRLSKIRTRTQIVHSTSLSGHFESETRETSGSFKSRPKSNLFG
ncbi:ankyrin repeat domain-containing protein SOWAHC-like [Pygocentrus nattereri]|uniref:SOWAHA-C winged helix-turn-helix domain-containing protein n=1 Tax=Pygocentrus nattereri TaxID=42514 RepID=A0AAR2K804_PYGNA|nr:ankyrin repeat domain-containing protein SOWAHC-like [Pygocentrus nattereri]